MTMQPILPMSQPTAAGRTKDIPAPAQANGLDQTVNVVKAESPASVATQAPSREEVAAAMQEVEKALSPVARNLQFSVDEQTGKTVIKVMDATTSEVIRQFPSEELLSIAKALDHFSGLLLKQKV